MSLRSFLIVLCISSAALAQTTTTTTQTTTRTTTTTRATTRIVKPKPIAKPPMSMALPTSPTTLPFGLGVNIHFTEPHGDEMKPLAAAGFTFIRMDFSWAATEKARGEYDWTEYETLLDALAPHGIR